MSGIQISGTLINVFEKDKRNNDDDAKWGLQVMAELANRNGDSRMQLHEISCKHEDIAKALMNHKGKEMSIPVGIFSPHDSSNVIFFLAPGTQASDFDVKPLTNSTSQAQTK